MNKQSGERLQASDFVMTLQEMGSQVDVCDEARHDIGMITRSDLVSMFFDHFNPVNNIFKKDRAT